jgi:hypothetical protein
VSSALRLFLAVALGLTLAWRGLQWFTDHLDAMNHAPPPAAASSASPSPAARPAPKPAGPPTATAEEIAGLAASETPDRWKALELLERRASSPELIAALDEALDVDVTTQFHTKVVCLRAQLSGDDIAAFASRHLPATDPYSQTEEGRIASCLVRALSRSETTALEARDMLMRFLFSPTFERREAARLGVKRWTFEALPRDVRDRLFSPRDDDRREALHVAAALGALSYQPEIFERGLSDRSDRVRYSAKLILARAATPAAARMLAAAVLDMTPHEGEQLLASHKYESRLMSEIWRGFMAIASDESEDEATRARAMEIVSLKGEREQRAGLEALTQSSSDFIRSTASAALAEHQRRYR